MLWFSIRYGGCFKYRDYVSVLNVYQSDGLWKGTVQMAAFLGKRCSVAPTRGYGVILPACVLTLDLFFLQTSLSIIVCSCPAWMLIQTIPTWVSREQTGLFQSWIDHHLLSWRRLCSASLIIVSIRSDHFRSWKIVASRHNGEGLLNSTVTATVLSIFSSRLIWLPHRASCSTPHLCPW